MMSDKQPGQRVLVVGVDNEIGVHLCVRLALDGHSLFAVGEEGKILSQIAREVHDVRGQFEWTVARDRTAAQAWLAEIVDRVGTITTLVTLESDRPLPRQNLTNEPVAVGRPDFCHMITAMSGADQTLMDVDVVRMNLELDHGNPTLGLPANAAVVVAEAATRLLSQPGMAGGREAHIQFTPEQIRVVAHTTGEPRRFIFSRQETAFRDVYVKRTNRGRGVFAGVAFCRGDLVLRTAGKLIGFQTEHSIQIAMDRHVEPNPPVRHINHSCEPNLGIRTNGDGLPDFVALQAILADEELTFDYAMTEYRHYERSDPELEFSLACKCGSARCRGRLGYYSELPDELRQEYAGYIAGYLTEVAQPSR